MARFSVGGDEEGNEEGANGDRRLPKRHRTSGPIVSSTKRSSTSAASTSTIIGGRAVAANHANPASRSITPQPPSRPDGTVLVEELEDSEEETDSFTDTSSSTEEEEDEETEDEYVDEQEGRQGAGDRNDVQPANVGVTSVPIVNGGVREPVETVGDTPVPVSVTLSDPEVLDCPICLEPLSSPVYQCENGHIACASCCINMRNKCAICSWPIGYNRCRAIEKVIESARVPCRNMQLGCMESLWYGKRLEHEKICKYAPCTCPLGTCPFTGLAKSVYAHFATSHQRFAHLFRLDYSFTILLVHNQKHVFLQDKYNNTLFILTRSIEPFGSYISVVCIAPSSSDQRFVYTLSAQDGKSSLQLKTVAECSPKWLREDPVKKYLVIPKGFMSSNGDFRFELTIRRDMA